MLDRVVKMVSRIMAVIAGLALVVIALTIMAEITLRTFFVPLVGGIEIIRVTFVISVFFAFAYVIVQDREIRVDVFRWMFPPRMLRIVDAAASLVTLAFFGFLLWFSAGRLWSDWTAGVYLEGRLLIPMWIPWSTITLGAMMAVIAAACSLLKHLSSSGGSTWRGAELDVQPENRAPLD